MSTLDRPGTAAWTIALALALTLAACEGGAPAPEEGAGTDTTAEGAAPTTVEPMPATPDTLPTPPPGSLLAIMIDLEKDMAGVAHGIWWTDFEAIAASATGIADHPKIPDEGRATIAETLGDEMSAFASLDRDVHDASVRIQGAAEAEDLDGVLEAWQATQDGCVACHQRFRERLKPVLSGARSGGS